MKPLNLVAEHRREFFDGLPVVAPVVSVLVVERQELLRREERLRTLLELGRGLVVVHGLVMSSRAAPQLRHLLVLHGQFHESLLRHRELRLGAALLHGRRLDIGEVRVRQRADHVRALGGQELEKAVEKVHSLRIRPRELLPQVDGIDVRDLLAEVRLDVVAGVERRHVLFVRRAKHGEDGVELVRLVLEAGVGRRGEREARAPREERAPRPPLHVSVEVE